MTVAGVFPGQGSQMIGMGYDLAAVFPAAPRILADADEILARPLSALIKDGPREQLDLTENAQPALFIANHIAWRALAEAGFDPGHLAGHSLGELSAYSAAGAFSFEEGLKIVERRAALMSRAARLSPGGMVAVLGLDEPAVADVAASAGVEIANLNSPGQIVISGGLKSLEAASLELDDRGAKKTVKLAVSGAFHSSAMAGAADEFADYLSGVEIKSPDRPVIANAAAGPVTEVGEVRAELAGQLIRPVRWHESIDFMIGRGVSSFVEVGPGKVLRGLIRRISRDVEVQSSAERLGHQTGN